MSNALFGMGIEDVFLPFRADFSPLTDDVGISLSNVIISSLSRIIHDTPCILDIPTELLEMGLGWNRRWRRQCNDNQIGMN